MTIITPVFYTLIVIVKIFNVCYLNSVHISKAYVITIISYRLKVAIILLISEHVSKLVRVHIRFFFLL